MPELIIKLGDNVVQKYFFVNEPMSIGRAPDNEIVIENLAISRNHAVISATGESFLIKDLGSSNGTFVNGEKVTQALLNDKDVISIGKHKLYFYNAAPAREVIRRPSFADADCTMLVTHVPVTAELEQIRGKHHATVHPLNGDVTRLGRGAQNDIRLSDWFVSKEHATITRVEDAFVLRDLGSWRHTFVNDTQIEEAVLRHGDVIQVGPTVQFRFAVTSGMEMPVVAPAPRLKVTAMPTYEPPVEFNLAAEAPAAEAWAQESPEHEAPAAASNGNYAMTARFDADVLAQHEAEESAAEPQAEAAEAEEPNGVYMPVRLEELVEKIAAASVSAAAEALSTDPHPEPTAQAETPATEEAIPTAEAEAAESPADPDAWLNQFPQRDDGAQQTMRLNHDAEFAITEDGEDELNADAPGPIEGALADAASAEQEARQSDALLEIEAEAATEAKNETPDEQPELAEVGVAADTGNPSDEHHLGEDVRIWERALLNRSVLIRKQAARKLKQLTGKDYDY